MSTDSSHPHHDKLGLEYAKGMLKGVGNPYIEHGDAFGLLNEHRNLLIEQTQSQELIAELQSILKHGIESVEYLFRDFKMRIDIGNCDGYKDDEGYVFPVGNSVVMGLDTFLDKAKTHLKQQEQE